MAVQQEQALTAALATLNALAATMQNNGLVDFCERLDDFVQQCTAARAALQAEDAVTVLAHHMYHACLVAPASFYRLETNCGLLRVQNNDVQSLSSLMSL